VLRVEIAGEMRDCGSASDHMRRVAAVAADAGQLVDVFASKARVAPAMAALAARTDADLESFDPRAERIDDADDLIPGNARMSLWRTPQAWAPTRISSGPATGMSRSSATNGPPRSRTTIARIFVIARSPSIKISQPEPGVGLVLAAYKTLLGAIQRR